MSEKAPSRDDAYFTSICIESCGGRCCDPWWGIVEFSVNVGNKPKEIARFKETLTKEIVSREQRIREKYITSETPPRRLFKKPERYNVELVSAMPSGGDLAITLRALFAFRCLFLSDKKVCTIHPAVIGGDDIRPPHCGYMGTLDAKYGEKGYCRIIHASTEEGDDASAKIAEAVALEERSSKQYFETGFDNAGDAAISLIERIKDYLKQNMSEPKPVKVEKKPGRNDPCDCGSGKKYKKCHGE